MIEIVPDPSVRHVGERRAARRHRGSRQQGERDATRVRCVPPNSFPAPRVRSTDTTAVAGLAGDRQGRLAAIVLERHIGAAGEERLHGLLVTWPAAHISSVSSLSYRWFTSDAAIEQHEQGSVLPSPARRRGPSCARGRRARIGFRSDQQRTIQRFPP